jgi:hypothetical protein
MADWRPVPGHEDYEVSSVGQVRRVDSGRILKPRVHAEGYHIVALGRGGRDKLVHRLVLSAFVGPAPEGLVARHLNGVPGDNTVSNLTWGTQQQNMQDSVDHGTRACGSDNGNSRLLEEEVEAIRMQYATGLVSQRALAGRYGVSQRTIWNIVNEKQWATQPA